MEMLKVNFPRLQADIEALATIGRESDHGLYRMAFSDGDMAGRKWLLQQAEVAGLNAHVDGAANIHLHTRQQKDIASVVTGSHIDTVPGAGHLDGALGVLVGLECLRSIQAQGFATKRPLECIAFTDEEGRFGGMLGSQAMCGLLSPEYVLGAEDLNGMKLQSAMSAQGLNAMDILRAQRRADSMHAFVELHIEQGPVLDRQQKSIGLVDSIAGLFRWQVRLIGESNHAGTTPMDMRRDALQGLAETSGEISRILEEYGSPRSVATIGHVECYPGAANVVPGRVVFSLDVRDTDARVLKDLADAFRRAIAAIARRRELMFEFDVMSEIAPVKCDTGILNTIEHVSRALGVEHLRMHSGAAHDSQFMARLTRTAMIFVPSKAGKSHSAAEWTAWEDIEHGANVLLNTLYRLAME